MAFMVSKAAETSFSDSEKENRNLSEEKDNVTRQLYLKSHYSSSSTHSSPEALDKEVVLKRIRYHKCLNKVKGTFRALVSSSGQANSASIHEQKLFDQDDAFSSP